MSVKTRDLGMTPLNDLFSTDESRAESKLKKIVTLNPAEISDFPNHLFKVITDYETTIIMVDSNLQRETILPFEKAFAYKMKLDAIKRQGQRSDLTSATKLQKSAGKTSCEILAEQAG